MISSADVVQVGVDVPVKRDSSSNGSPDILQRIRRRRHAGPFFLNFDNSPLKVVSDVISGVVVDSTDVKVRVKFGDSRSS